MAVKTRILNLRTGQSNQVGNQQWVDFTGIYKQERNAKAYVYDESRPFQAGVSNNEDTFTSADDQGGFELSEYYQLEQVFGTTDYSFHMQKMAIGGTQLAAFGGTDWSTSSSGEYYDIWMGRVRDFFKQLIGADRASGLSPYYWVAIDWHQGEQDATNETYADAYGDNFETFVKSVNAYIVALMAELGVKQTQYRIDWFVLELNQIGVDYPNPVREGMRDFMCTRSDMYLKPSDHLEEDDPNRIHYSVAGYEAGGIEFANQKYEIFTRTSVPEFPMVIMIGDENARGEGALGSFDSDYTAAQPGGFIWNDSYVRFIYNEEGFNEGADVNSGGFEMSLVNRLLALNDKCYLYKRGVAGASNSSYLSSQSNYTYARTRWQKAMKLVRAHGYKPKVYVVLWLGRNDGAGAASNYQTNVQSIINDMKTDIAAAYATLVPGETYSDPTFILPTCAYNANSQETVINTAVAALAAANTDVTSYDTSGLGFSGTDYTVAGYEAGGIAIANLIGTVFQTVDTTRPVIQSVVATEGNSYFTVTLDESTTAAGITGWSLSAGTAISVSSVRTAGPATIIEFNTSRAFTSSDTDVTLTVAVTNDAADAAGNDVAAVTNYAVTLQGAIAAYRTARVTFEGSEARNSETDTLLTITGTPTYDTTDGSDTAFVFADGRYIDLDVTLTQSYTKTAIVKTTDLTASNIASSNGTGTDHAAWMPTANDLGMGHTSAGLSEVTDSEGTMSGYSDVKVRLTFTYDHGTTTGKIYINGTEVESGSITTGAATGGGIRLGAYQAVGGTSLNGNMYEYEQYSIALSAAQIATLTMP